MVSHSFGHKRNSFTSKVIDPDIKYQDDPSGLQTLSSTRVTVKIHYEIQRLHAILLKEDPQKSTMLERTKEKREAECDVSLVDLGCLEKTLALVSPELSRIGVRRVKHKGIVKKIVNVAREAEFVIEKCGKVGLRVVMNEGIEVELLRTRCKWYCDTCLRVGDRKCMIKKLLRHYSVDQDHDHDDHDRDHDDHDRDCDGCSICLEEFSVGRVGFKLPCMHKFHAKCIIKWLMNKSSCPLCRFLYAHLDKK